MPTKLSTAVYRPDLARTALFEYMEEDSMELIGTKVMPIYNTSVHAGTYPVIPKERLLEAPLDLTRASSTGVNRGNREYERGTFTTQRRADEEAIDDADRTLSAEEGIDEDFWATKILMGRMLKNHERLVRNAVYSSGFTENAVSNPWDNATSGTPIDDILEGVLAIRKTNGMGHDYLILGYEMFRTLATNDQVKEALNVQTVGLDIANVSKAQMASALGVKDILIGGGVYNSADPGEDAIITDLWPNNKAALIKVSTGNIRNPGFGRTFLYTAYSPQFPTITQYRDEAITSDIIRAEVYMKEELIQSKNSSGTVVSDIAAACIYIFSSLET